MLPARNTLLICGIVALALLAGAAARADSGAIQDPTGCATGSAVANCRDVPDTGLRGGDSRDSGSQRGLSNGDRLRKTSPLPSERIQRAPAPTLPPPGSTGLGGGSTGLGD
jgi:hypothetical protein